MLSIAYAILLFCYFQVENLHQYVESMKTEYLNEQRRMGNRNDPFLEANRREAAKQEAAARRVHPTLHLPAPAPAPAPAPQHRPPTPPPPPPQEEPLSCSCSSSQPSHLQPCRSPQRRRTSTNPLHSSDFSCLSVESFGRTHLPR